MADAVAGVAVYAQELHVLGSRLEALEADPAVQLGKAMRARIKNPRLAPVRRVAGAALHRARQRSQRGS
jgi:hypothetical protein